MRSHLRPGLLSQALLMLGVVGPPPPPTREQLDAEGPSDEQLRDWVPERPEEVSQVTFTTSKGAMVGKTAFYEDALTSAHVLGVHLTTEIAKVNPLCLYSAKKPSPSEVWGTLCTLPREPRTHNRKAQRANKKTRNAAKKMVTCVNGSLWGEDAAPHLSVTCPCCEGRGCKALAKLDQQHSGARSLHDSGIFR